uniref:ANK_REP_REGION domain-containing protein n=1 Tax=Mesocestoides corti TaxID=53468 RepID=A0A5K3F0F0_MESCO
MMSTTMKASHIIAVLNICKRGDVVFLRKLLASNCNFDEVKDRKGRNALHYCAETDKGNSGETKPGGRLACATLLLESEFKLQNQPDSDGFLPFHHSIIHGNIPLAKLFISHGMDVNSLVAPPSNRANFMEEGNTAVYGRSALHLAVIYASYETLEFLLSGSFEDSNGNTHKFSVDVSLQDAQSATALHYAVQLPEGIAASMIKCIVERSNMDINCTDAHGRTPLIWAATIGASLSTSMLLELGADLCKSEKSGLTALHCASSRGHTSTVQAILKHLEKVEMSPEEKAKVLDAQDVDGCTPLFYSVTMGHYSITKQLLAAGADPSATDSRGRGLLHCTGRTMAKGGIDIIDLLIEHGVDPKRVNAVGDTALHEACANANKACVERLLQIEEVSRNVVNLRNASNQTPLQITTLLALREDKQAEASGNAVEICQMLCKAGALIGTNNASETTPLSLVRNCLRNTPNYRPALELERLFNGCMSRKSSKAFSKSTDIQETATVTATSQESSEVSSLPCDQFSSEDENCSKSISEYTDELHPRKSKKTDTDSKSEAIDTSEIKNFVNQEIDDAVSQEVLARVSREPLSKDVPKSESLRSASVSQGVSSKASSRKRSANASSNRNLANASSRTSSTRGSRVSLVNSSIGGKSTTSSSSLHISQSGKPMHQASRNGSIATTETSSRKSVSLSSLMSESKKANRSLAHAPSTLRSLRKPTTRSTSAHNEKASAAAPSQSTSTFSAFTPSQTRRSASNHRSEAAKLSTKPTSSASGVRSVPLRARHSPAWTQTSFDATMSSKLGRASRSSEFKSDLAKPRRRPSSCDFHRKTDYDFHQHKGIERQKLPQPTITPYLTPVARWPRAMASMLLMGEVSPLYCAQTLNVAPHRRQNRRGAEGTEKTQARPAIEARMQLSIAEKDFVKLAAQVLDQYDTLLIERQKLARTRAGQHTGDK